ncbi:hypothetical protein TWF225_006899 [Orbilia oligospora]|uniref:Uncharacterized protein n=1 Tax=Orbilia oligospora TaxID=2813651 RepID=A0A7C8U3J2_ORBOL|nr:hypothetical protein TWF751_008364 [Orbilia oligospora]KAF3194351.1 hypothetical protein TWF225_006899 [Orbilia oligospora]KAF3246229.1 hypothetical protein TWF128_009036 [Orbilia oligospora]KAF3264103.1 hypothetical protein TWF217_003260 [Orbilia oligospora]KAF3296148.1 hypothetical protein TWF132_011611 [Orbilia oligospora]
MYKKFTDSIEKVYKPQQMARDDGDLPEAVPVPSTLPQTYQGDHDLPQVVETTTPQKWRHPQFAGGSYTPSPPFIPPLEDKRILGLRRTTFFLSLALAILIVFGIALGAGLGVGLRKGDSNSSSNANSSGAQTSSITSSPPSTSTTSTTSSTTTSTTTACNPLRTAAVTNGGFEAGVEASDIRPWYIPDLVAPATYEILNVNGSNVFHAICNSDLEHGAYTKIKLAQQLRTCPDTDYNFEFRYNFLPGNNQNAYIVFFIDGEEIANIRAGPNDWVTRRGNFTSKRGGNSTLLQVDFAPVAFDSQEFFVDDFEVTPA